MRSQISLLQVIDFFLLYAALGFLVPIFNISLNPFQAAPFWIVTSALFVLLLGLVLGLCNRHRFWDATTVKSFPKKFMKS